MNDPKHFRQPVEIYAADAKRIRELEAERDRLKEGGQMSGEEMAAHLNDATLNDKIVRFVQTYAPDEKHLRTAFINRLRGVLEEYGRNALLHGDLPDTEHPHRNLAAENALLRKALMDISITGIYGEGEPPMTPSELREIARAALDRIQEAKP